MKYARACCLHDLSIIQQSALAICIFQPSEFQVPMNQRTFKGLLAQTLAEEEGVEGCHLDFTIATTTR